MRFKINAFLPSLFMGLFTIDRGSKAVKIQSAFDVAAR